MGRQTLEAKLAAREDASDAEVASDNNEEVEVLNQQVSNLKRQLVREPPPPHPTCHHPFAPPHRTLALAPECHTGARCCDSRLRLPTI